MWQHVSLLLPPPLKVHSVTAETAHPPVCRPLITQTGGNVDDGKQPRAHRHKNVGCCVPVLRRGCRHQI